jgi:hypothetical protein
MVVDDDSATTAAETLKVKRALVAEITWAELYAKAIHKDLVAISTAVRRSQTNIAGPEMQETAEKLHDEIQAANRTTSELSKHARIHSNRSKGV